MFYFISATKQTHLTELLLAWTWSCQIQNSNKKYRNGEMKIDRNGSKTKKNLNHGLVLFSK